MARCPVPAGLQCEREDTGDARAEGLMGKQVGVTDGSVECQMRMWSDWRERGVAGKSVKMMEER